MFHAKPQLASFLAAGALAACHPTPAAREGGQAPTASSETRALPKPDASTEAAAAPAPKAPANDSPANSPPVPLALEVLPPGACGELECQRYPDAASALHVVLGKRPEILAVGEAHTLKEATHVESATARFERELLPVLAESGATELVVELLGPAANCEGEVRAVEEQQRPVKERQAESNSDRFVSLGFAARRLGVVPFILEPTCDEYRAVVSQQDGIGLMLELITKKTEEKLTRFFWKNQKLAVQSPSGCKKLGEPCDSGRLVLAYGGAMHNDIESTPEGQRYRFGARLSQLTTDRYIELDLIVPEYIKDSEVWQALPWYSAFNALPPSELVTLIKTGGSSYTLVFGRSASAR